jgi:hypothetical protein
MTPFSSLAREYRTTEDSTLAPREESVIGYPRETLADPLLETTRQPSDVIGLEENFLPKVVLRLPDLKAHTPWRSSALVPFARHLYWVVLALGALFAVWLIASGKKSTGPSRDEAPSWTNHSPMQGAAPASGSETTPALQWRASSSQAPSTESSEATRATQGEQPIAPVDGPVLENFPAPANPAARDESQTPSDGAAFGQSQTNMRTARAIDETRWDGSSGGVKPSEARPLGITSVVP